MMSQPPIMPCQNGVSRISYSKSEHENKIHYGYWIRFLRGVDTTFPAKEKSHQVDLSKIRAFVNKEKTTKARNAKSKTVTKNSFILCKFYLHWFFYIIG